MTRKWIFQNNLHPFCPLNPERASEFITCSVFFCKNQSSLISLLFLFRKKARSAYLFVCKRTHNGSLLLPPFYEYAFGVVASKPFDSSTKKRAEKVACGKFLSYIAVQFYSALPSGIVLCTVCGKERYFTYGQKHIFTNISDFVNKIRYMVIDNNQIAD